MFKSIRLVNFQAHIDSLIELDEGITSLVGESHNGKTSIMRGLNWAVNNEPSGTGFISYWAKHKTKKGLTVIDIPCKVECVRKDGNVLIRERSADFNGYRINGKDLARAGVGVPREVHDWFNMGEVNIQNQHDSLFLLHSGGKGGQEVARFLNSVVKLDEIPRALSAVESIKRSVKKQRDVETEKITSYDKNIVALEWVRKAGPILERLEKIENNILTLKEKEKLIIEQIEGYDELQAIVKSLEWNKDLPLLLEKWFSVYNKESNSYDYQTFIDRSLTAFSENQHRLNDFDWLPEAQETSSAIKNIENDIGFSTLHEQTLERNVKKYDTAALFLENNQRWLIDVTDVILQLEMLGHTIEELETKKILINNTLFNVKEYESELEENYITIQMNKKLLPKTCVLCGAPLKEGKYESSR